MKNSRPRHFFLIFLTLIALSTASARKITFPVNGLLVAAKEPVPLEAEWDESWFTESSPTKYNHGIARIAALLSEISYIQAEKHPDSNELLQSYRLMGFKDENISWNYMLDYTAPISGNNQAAYSFASKDIQTPQGSKKLVLVVLRGTPLSANEWISNINVSDNTHKDVLLHEGFFRTCENIQKELLYYLLKKKIDPKNACFLITGHSRGGALANILGAKLDDEGVITGERLFVYTFAAPNVSQEEKTSNPKYNFIWNIINAEDIVPSVPPNRNNWKWKKYGQTKVIVNYWNSNPEKYLDDYLPRMNQYFKQMLLRNYAPFKNGPFVQIQISRLLTKLYRTVENYYDDFFSLRALAESLFWKIFPESDDDDELEAQEPEAKSKEKLPFLVRIVQKNVNSNIEGGFEYAIKALADMHGCETYLSWLLALGEDEAYSSLGSTQLSIDGSYDCAVYDDNGKLLAKITDGIIELYSLKVPVAGMPFPEKNVLGFPGNQNLTMMVYKDSLAPTLVTYQIESYDAQGQLLDISEKRHIFPRSTRAIKFQVGKETLENSRIETEKLSKEETSEKRKAFGLRHNLKFKFQPEFSYSNEKILSLGFRAGNQEIFGLLQADFYTRELSDAFSMTLGLGHQTNIYGRFYFDTEALAHLVWTEYDKEKSFNFVPAARLSLAFKPRHRLQFFAGFLFDAHIEGFNDDAVIHSERKNHFSSIKFSDSFHLLPSIQFGIRF